MKIRHKNHKQENFPVGMMIIGKDKRRLIFAYYKFARFGDDIADNPKLKPQVKVEKLYELEEIFLGIKAYKGQKLKFAVQLREEFIKHDLSIKFATDLLTAFRKDAMGFDYQTWAQLIDYCKYSAAPVGKFMLAIHHEHPSTYLPATSLCAALQIVNHIQDIKYDLQVQKRIYLPAEIMKKFHLRSEDLIKDKSSLHLQKAIEYVMEKVQGMLKDGELLPPIIQSLSLRTEVCIILSLTNIMVKRILKGDVLAEEIRLSAFDWLRAVIKGCFKAWFTKTKTLPFPH